ncbi:M28 family peptidase [Planococcus shenhongbingii]|uniref:M28 family peptidase n=1 Tax=Planococcus shenhongbingii TaxID=3058398 RepID=UPI00260A6ED4|nr:M28 family peptidase [Planococcus sp. N016]WKA59171.1 M28 family peptidase [Planococcus sp. N016]
MPALLKEQEKLFLDEINLNVPGTVLNKFLTLIRESGSVDEKLAVDFLISYLEEWQVTYKVHEPELYVSIPKRAYLKTTSPFAKKFNAKTPAFSAITGHQTVSGELSYVATDFVVEEEQNISKKIVLTEGYPTPEKVQQLTVLGARALVFINPGETIHEGICTPIWGAPDLDNYNTEPPIAVLAVNKSDGEELKEWVAKGNVTADCQTHLEQGWKACPIVDAFIEGTEEPDKYVLLHGHLDSWHEGIGDNATGNAALLEMIRIFQKNKDKLKRSIRVAIWTGHSTGSYGGSTWFADQFGLEIEQNCIAQINCKSPGCRWATSYECMTWTSEAEDFCKEVIKDAVGQKSKGSRPLRTGDYSFNNIGVTSYFMLSSTIPEVALQKKGYYSVGGCGGNIEWHTEQDLMHVADLDILTKDIKVYLVGVLRAVNSSIHPFNFAATAKEFKDTLQFYQRQAGKHFDFGLSMQEADNLEQELLMFYKGMERLRELPATASEVQRANAKLRKLARILIPINFSRMGKYRHDPALNVPALPDLAPAGEFEQLQEGSHEHTVLKTHLKRGENRVASAIREARELVNRP